MGPIFTATLRVEAVSSLLRFLQGADAINSPPPWLIWIKSAVNWMLYGKCLCSGQIFSSSNTIKYGSNQLEVRGGGLHSVTKLTFPSNWMRIFKGDSLFKHKLERRK